MTVRAAFGGPARRVIFDAPAFWLHYAGCPPMLPPLSVLHVYSGNLFGGVERMLLSLATLADAKNQAHFALCFEGKLSHALRQQCAPVTLLGPVRLRKPLSALRARRRLARFLRSHDVDAVVCHSIWIYCIFASVVARAGRAPILFLHDIPDPKALLYRWAWRRPPALCIVNSAATAEPLARMRTSVPVHIVHPLVASPATPDAAAVRQLRARWNANPEETVILQASRFDSWKGHRNLLEALATMRHVSGWKCWIAGAPQRPEEETYRRELLALTESLQLSERVSFIGHRDDMETVLAACDIYCQPNETPEPFGMVFVEAMYAGKPVVGRALGGALEIVTPECGILCPAGTASLASALTLLVGNVELRQQMSQVGPARASALCGPERFRAQFAAAIKAAPFGLRQARLNAEK